MNYNDKIYGNFELSGVIEALIQTTVLQRLKKIHQGGPIFLVNPQMNQTRFEHSIGVMLLIKKLGGSIEAQIAGLMHDISHTAFSHLVDYVMEIEEEDYHEKRYEIVLKHPDLVAVLKQYGYTAEQFLDLEQYPILEYPLPNLSADRIDYTLRDLFQMGKISPKEVDWFLDGLLLFENRIVLKSIAYGQWFQKQYEYLVREYFGGQENKEINIIMKKIIKRLMTKGIIEERDFHQDDFHLLAKMNTAIDLQKEIASHKMQEIQTESLKIKKRAVDPEILVGNEVVKLSALNA